MEITISEVIRITNLIKKVNCTSYAIVSEVAKEMGVKKTAFMQFIEDNYKLFKVVPYIGGITSDSKAKNYGLVIKEVYNTAENNPATDEWLEVKKKEWEKKLHVSAKYYYNSLEFYYIAVDNAVNDSCRYNEYRNTPKKIKELEDAGILKLTTCGYGGLSDYYKMEAYRVTEEGLEKLAAAGWTTDYQEVRNKEGD